MSGTRRPKPSIRWDGKTWHVSLPIQDGKRLQAKWSPAEIYVVRIRQKGVEEWSVGFETPVTGCNFSGLERETEYEIEVRAKNSHGLSSPVYRTIRTGSDRSASNVIPFPGR